jgi:hypothetical protein
MKELIIIEPGRQERHHWRELWRYREMFRVLAWRDLLVCYKQMALGAIWRADPAIPDVGGIYDHLWSHRAAAVRRICAICADGLCRPATVDLLCNRTVGGVQ